jgi:predicted kinase
VDKQPELQATLLMGNVMLVGIPGSGKSTAAKQLGKQSVATSVISTDAIREELYGSESELGTWGDIEARINSRLEEANSDGSLIIYDATNYRRGFRGNFLLAASQYAPQRRWTCLIMDTPLEECLERNARRERQVPEFVIKKMSGVLEREFPSHDEGFETIIKFSNLCLPL